MSNEVEKNQKNKTVWAGIILFNRFKNFLILWNVESFKKREQ